METVEAEESGSRRCQKARKYTADEMREMAAEAEVMEVADQFCGHDMDTIASMLRQSADILERIRNEVSAIEKMPTANLDGAFEHQKANGEKLVAKIAFYIKVKEIVGESE